MYLKFWTGFLSTLFLSTTVYAAPNGSWKLTVKTSNAWTVNAKINGDQLSLREGSCVTKKATANSLNAKCKLTSGTCGPGTMNIKLKFDGSRVKGNASGSCRGTVNYRGGIAG